MAQYKFKSDVLANGTPGVLEVGVKKPVLQKTFLKDYISEGTIKSMPDGRGGMEEVLFIDEDPTTGAIDRDTKQAYTGKAQWFIDPTRVELANSATSSLTEEKNVVPDNISKILTTRNIIIGILIIIILIIILK